ncbi:MAG: PKD domain-containing protein, partial [DPANN group archaeon]|nr:PKD domain-containing protein [DPANN group archaeon]
MTFTITDVYGLSDSEKVKITVTDKPPAPTVTIQSPEENDVFNTHDVLMHYYMDQGATVRIYDGSSNVYTTGNNAGSYDYTYTDLSYGWHTLKVAIDNDNGQDSDDVKIRINAPPVLDPIGSRSVQEESTLSFGVSGSDPDGDAVSASGLPSGASFSGQSFSWTPKDGQDGVYYVTFKITDVYGLSDSEKVKITVTDKPVHDLRAGSIVYPNTKTEGDTLSWSTKIYNEGNRDESSTVRFYVDGAEQASCRRSFSDLAPLSQTGTYSCSYVAKTEGTYTLKASVDVVSGETDTADNSWQHDTLVTNNAPSATADANPKSGYEPLDVSFTCSATGGNKPYSYSWDFGDGASSSSQNPSHTYAVKGQYHAECTVTDTDGDADSDGGNIDVLRDYKPSVVADADPKSGYAPLDVQFTCTGTGGDAPLSYGWTFGDGTSSDSQNPVHTYLSPGQYVATCTVTDNDGDTDTDGGDINVYEDLKPSVVAD